MYFFCVTLSELSRSRLRSACSAVPIYLPCVPTQQRVKHKTRLFARVMGETSRRRETAVRANLSLACFNMYDGCMTVLLSDRVSMVSVLSAGAATQLNTSRTILLAFH